MNGAARLFGALSQGPVNGLSELFNLPPQTTTTNHRRHHATLLALQRNLRVISWMTRNMDFWNAIARKSHSNPRRVCA